MTYRQLKEKVQLIESAASLHDTCNLAWYQLY